MSTPRSLPSALLTAAADNGSAPCDTEDPALRLPLATCYTLIFLLGLAGNLFALWVFLFLRSSRNSVRALLINCAVADLVLLACLPFRVAYHLNGNRWALGAVACRLVGNLFYMNMYISIALLGMIGLDRHLRLRGKSRSGRGADCRCGARRWPWSWVACAALWGLSLAAATPMVAAAEDRDHPDKCYHYRPRSARAAAKAYFNAALVAAFWLVFAALAVCYARIGLRLLRASRDGLPNARRYAATARKSFVVLLVFAVCFAPYHAFRPLYVHGQLHWGKLQCAHKLHLERVNEAMLLFSALNSCLDPVMYFLLSGSVRKAALRALGNRFRSDGAATNSSTTEGCRRSSVPAVGLLNTPRASICVAKAGPPQRTELTVLPPGGIQ